MKKSAAEYRQAINALRADAGLKPGRLHGTSISSLQVGLMLAKQGLFSPDPPEKPLSNHKLAAVITDKLGLGEGHVRVVKGQIRIYRGFFYSPKQSEEDWATKLTAELTAAGFTLAFVEIDGDHYRPFRGGDPVHKGSHYCAVYNRTDLPSA